MIPNKIFEDILSVIIFLYVIFIYYIYFINDDILPITKKFIINVPLTILLVLCFIFVLKKEYHK